jgi:hypothetical protein
MTSKSRLTHSAACTALAVLCAVGIGRGDAFAFAWFPIQTAPQSSSQEASAPISPDQLDSLVAPIALYPDPLLAQVLAASTYPLEIMQLQQWLTKNPGLSGKALAEAVSRQPWDASVQAMAVLPDVVKRLADNIQWTTDLGNAFLAQESDTMNAVQRMRQKAEGTGSLQSTPQQVVETRVVENKSVIVIEPSSPETIYVPSYNPIVVYGAAPVYAYPPISYPSAGSYAAGAAISFGLGVAAGAFWGGGGWGWNAGWGRGDITVNRNNAFVRNSNFNRTGTWQHNAVHRGSVAYGNRTTAARYGGAGAANRAAGTAGLSNRAASGSLSNRAGTTGRTGAVGGAGAANRAAGTTGLSNRAASGTSINRSGTVGTTGRSGSVNRGSVSGGQGARSGGFSGGGGNRGGGGFSGGGGGHRGGGGGSRGGGGRR